MPGNKGQCKKCGNWGPLDEDGNCLFGHPRRVKAIKKAMQATGPTERKDYGLKDLVRGHRIRQKSKPKNLWSRSFNSLRRAFSFIKYREP